MAEHSSAIYVLSGFSRRVAGIKTKIGAGVGA
jgi:uncharacterized RmlC-like cupin family protein